MSSLCYPQILSNFGYLLFDIFDRAWPKELSFSNFWPPEWGVAFSAIQSFEWWHLQASLMAVVVGKLSKRQALLPISASLYPQHRITGCYTSPPTLTLSRHWPPSTPNTDTSSLCTNMSPWHASLLSRSRHGHPIQHDSFLVAFILHLPRCGLLFPNIAPRRDLLLPTRLPDECVAATKAEDRRLEKKSYVTNMYSLRPQKNAIMGSMPVNIV